MEICRCEDYRKAVEHCKIFNIGTLHPLIGRVETPEGLTLKWTRRRGKPIFVELPRKKTEEEILEPKWIPVCPGLISQRLVNENKGIYCPF